MTAGTSEAEQERRHAIVMARAMNAGFFGEWQRRSTAERRRSKRVTISVNVSGSFVLIGRTRKAALPKRRRRAGGEKAEDYRRKPRAFSRSSVRCATVRRTDAPAL
jgi:hypothetical protein